MKYINANLILPDTLVEELQKYIQGGYLYVPTKEQQRRPWGELSGSRKALSKRNAQIHEEYCAGVPIETIARKYFLSVYAIRKIIYQKNVD